MEKNAKNFVFSLTSQKNINTMVKDIVHTVIKIKLVLELAPTGGRYLFF